MKVTQLSQFSIGMFIIAVSCNAQSNSKLDDKDIEALEKQLDLTIRSACHGFLVDAMPDILSEAREWINEHSPYCQSVRTLPTHESAYEKLSEYTTEVSTIDSSTDGFSAREYFRALESYDIACDDWMCQHIRLTMAAKGTSVTMQEYEHVKQYCGGGYGCIDNWFQDWPKPLPQMNTGNVQLSLDSLLSDSPAVSLKTQDMDSTSFITANQQVTISLDGVFEARHQNKLDSVRHQVDHVRARLEQMCQCSLSNQGCYELPSEELLNFANQAENTRFTLCQAGTNTQTSDTLETLESSLAKLTTHIQQVSELDTSVRNESNVWENKQKQLLAEYNRRKQNASDKSFLAAMGSVVVGGVIASTGQITAEQAATNAVNIARNIENSVGPAPRKHNPVRSSVTNVSANVTTSPLETQGNQFSCYASRQQICIDYSITRTEVFTRARNQCVQGGNRILNSCEKSGSSCTISNSQGTETVFSYFSDHNSVKSACTAQGGYYRLYE